MYADYPDDKPIPYHCDKSFDPSLEISKYVAQLIYLIPGILLNIAVLKAIFLTQKKLFRENSFFIIFSMDCMASLYLLLVDTFIYRVMIYFTPFCDFFGEYLSLPLFPMKCIYVLYHYSRAVKSIIQIFITLNRMTCVTIPLAHALFWKNGVRVAIFVTATFPFAIVWHPIIGRVYGEAVNGGMVTKFTKPIPWAGLATSQLILVIIALGFTAVCTSFTLYGMIKLSNRIKSAERSLCFASFFISAGFFALGMTQLSLALCPHCDIKVFNLLMVTLYYCFDFLNVCSPLTLILVSSQLRHHILGKQRPMKSKVEVLQKTTISETYGSVRYTTNERESRC